MHDHNYQITFLKTPFGYLTSAGFTQDINSKDILLLPSNTYGKYSSMVNRVNYFSKFYNLNQTIYEKLIGCIAECETITYRCAYGWTWCEGCTRKNICDFWNNDRARLNLSRLY